jgi:hypothetical protein
MRMLTLHIGLPKTATTFLQYRIFNRQREITYIHQPRDRDRDAIERLLKRQQRAGRRELASLEQRIVRVLPPGDVLVSNENISIAADEVWTGRGPTPTRLAERVARLADRLDGVRVVVGIRRQDQWLASRYAESAKAFPEFCQRDFEERVARLCSRPLEGALQWLDYDAAFAALVDHLGDGNVLLLPSEALADEPEHALGRLEEFLGHTGLVSVYRAQADSTDLRRNALSVGQNRWQMRGREAMLALPDQLEAVVLRRFADGNRLVAKAAGLELGRFGYH